LVEKEGDRIPEIKKNLNKDLSRTIPCGCSLYSDVRVPAFLSPVFGEKSSSFCLELQLDAGKQRETTLGRQLVS
jgi:hypothetical protein